MQLGYAITMCLCRRNRETLENHHKGNVLLTKFIAEGILQLQRIIKPSSKLEQGTPSISGTFCGNRKGNVGPIQHLPVI